MSHFTRIKTRMVSREFILGALDTLGYRHQEGDLTVKGFAGIKARVDIKIPAPLFSCEIGFRKQGEAYEVVADWYGAKGIKQQEFVRLLTREYARRAALSELEKQGFTMVSEEQEKSGQIHLVLRRMA